MWCYPSRGRPEKAAALLASMVAHGSVARGVLVIHGDDPSAPAYRALPLPTGWRLAEVQAGIIGCAQSLNAVFFSNQSEPWYGWIADDNTVETHGFEQVLIEAAGSWNIASADDCWQANFDSSKSRMHGATIFGGDFLRTLGYWALPGLQHYFIDDVWEMIGRALNNWRVIMKIKTPHLHHMNNKALRDDVYDMGASTEAHDKAVFTKWKRSEAREEIPRLRANIWKHNNWDLDRAKTRSVMMGFPCFDKPCVQHEGSAIQTGALCTALGIEHAYVHAQGQPTDKARNSIMKAFLESEMTDLLMVDADMAWNAWDVVKTLSVPHKIVAAVGRKRNDKSIYEREIWCVNPLRENGEAQFNSDKYGMIPVFNVGTGFIRISREAAIEILEARPDIKRDGWYKFFWFDDDGVDYISEDYAFCKLYRSIGGEVHIDPTIELNHFGMRDHKARFDYIFV